MYQSTLLDSVTAPDCAIYTGTATENLLCFVSPGQGQLMLSSHYAYSLNRTIHHSRQKTVCCCSLNALVTSDQTLQHTQLWLHLAGANGDDMASQPGLVANAPMIQDPMQAPQAQVGHEQSRLVDVMSFCCHLCSYLLLSQSFPLVHVLCHGCITITGHTVSYAM